MTKVPLNIVLYYVLPKIPQTHVTGVFRLRAVCRAARRLIDDPLTVEFWERYGRANMPGIMQPREALRTCKYICTETLDYNDTFNVRVFDRGMRKGAQFRPQTPDNPNPQHILCIPSMTVINNQLSVNAIAMARDGILFWDHVLVLFNDDVVKVRQDIDYFQIPQQVSLVIWVKPGHDVTMNGFIWGFKSPQDPPRWHCLPGCRFQCQPHYY